MRALLALLLLTSCDDTLFVGSGAGVALEGEEGYCAVLSVFQGKCVSCHSPDAGPIGNLDLATDAHAALVDQPSAASASATLVVPGSPDDSLLYRKITNTQSASEGGSMPPGALLDDASIEAVREWIADGASSECDDPGSVEVERYHPEGWAAAPVHGLATKHQTEQDCRDCHGDDLTGGDVGVSCDGCHVKDWRTTCTFCHGGVETETGAPPEDIDDDSDPATLSFRAHTSHVTEGIHIAWDCTMCHDKPTDVLTPGHLFDDMTAAMAEVDFTAGLSPQGTYLGNGSCSDLYCHGDGQGHNGSYSHDDPRPQCDSCHPDIDSGRDAWEDMSGEHEDHLREGPICADCHGDTTNPSQTIIGPELHVNGMPDIALPAGMAWNGSSCSGECHGEEHDAERWR